MKERKNGQLNKKEKTTIYQVYLFISLFSSASL